MIIGKKDGVHVCSVVVVGMMFWQAGGDMVRPFSCMPSFVCAMDELFKLSVVDVCIGHLRVVIIFE